MRPVIHRGVVRGGGLLALSPPPPWTSNIYEFQGKPQRMLSPPLDKFLTTPPVKNVLHQGTNVRKVISEVYAFFVLQCTVSWR